MQLGRDTCATRHADQGITGFHACVTRLHSRAGTPVQLDVPIQTHHSQTGTSVQPGTPVRPGVFFSLAQIMHSIKSYSANRIQRLLNRKGSIWQDENYDRIIRDEGEYLEKLNYIVNNPLKAGLVEKPEDYRWLYIVG